MQASTDEKTSAEQCMTEQREFLQVFAKWLTDQSNCKQHIERVEAEVEDLAKEVHQIRLKSEASETAFNTLATTLQPVLAAYEKGMTLKSKVSNLAVAYVILMVLFPQIAPASILSGLKVILAL